MLRKLLHSLLLVVLLVVPAACKKGEDGTSTQTTAAALPADAQTVEAFKKEAGFNGGTLKGKRVKIHGYVQSVSTNNVPVSAAEDKTVPFFFCKAAKAPAMKVKAHVLAEGSVDAIGGLEDCTLTSL